MQIRLSCPKIVKVSDGYFVSTHKGLLVALVLISTLLSQGINLVNCYSDKIFRKTDAGLAYMLTQGSFIAEGEEISKFVIVLLTKTILKIL